MTECVFCAIRDGTEPASLVFEDAECLAFMNIRPIRPGECMVIPRAHIDHFVDIPDLLAAHIMVVAQRLARAQMKVFRPLRVGYVVHGFGVPHAHLNCVPLHDGSDIISARHIVTDHAFAISETGLDAPARDLLDTQAQQLRHAVYSA